MKNHAISHHVTTDEETGEITITAQCIACEWKFTSSDSVAVDKEALKHADTEDS